MKKVHPSYFLLLICVLASCNEFIERSVEDKKVFLNSPADSTESSKYLQTFWWEPVDDALSYRVQIVSSTFQSPREFILDSLVKDPKFSVTLEPGEYQWRVRAENGSSQSFYTTRSLIIHEASLEKQQVQLKLPANGLITNQNGVQVSWYQMFGASKYLLQADTTGGNFGNENTLYINAEVQGSEYQIPSSFNGTCKWRVKAKSESEESKWSAAYSFTYDAVPPGKVTLSAPSAGQFVSTPVTLQWSSLADARKYQVYVLKSDSTSYNSGFPLTVTGVTYSFQGNSGETLLWKVRAIDAAGNVGAFSEVRSFTMQ